MHNSHASERLDTIFILGMPGAKTMFQCILEKVSFTLAA